MKKEDVAQSLITRVSVPELDAILGEQLRVFDKGFVRVVDYMGGDESIVQAARVSYGKGTRHTSEDRGLIRYLMRHHHTTPFEMCEIKLHVRVPMDCWRQWIRHRTANVNEYSTRYSEAIDDKQVTPATEWRSQAANNKQGSGDCLDEETGVRLSRREKQLHQLAAGIYKERLDAGNAREQARKDLPLSTYTEAYWKVDLHNLFHFLGLRMDAHAQQEIRDYATVIGEKIVARWCPIAWGAFKDYHLDSTSLTRLEIDIVSLLACNNSSDAVRLAAKYGWLEEGENGSFRKKPNRERSECEAKVQLLGLKVPWLEQ